MSRRSLEDQLGKAEQILEEAHTTHDVVSATGVLQRIADGLWQFNKIKNPSPGQMLQRQQLVDATDNLRVKFEVLGSFDAATPKERSIFVTSLIFAGKEKIVFEDKLAKQQPSLPISSPEPTLA